MRVGTQIFAPEGWSNLPANVVFHFLYSDSRCKRVLLVLFSTGKNLSNPKASILTMERHVFEEGRMLEMIIPVEEQAQLPIWLSAYDGFDISQVDSFRSSSAKISHRDRVENRLMLIAPAVRDFKLIVQSPDPSAEINQRAKKCSPSQNESRFRLWYLTYLCFGRDIWTLLPPFHLVGRWDRFDYSDVKFGAPSLAYGRSYGNGCSREMAEQCEKSFMARAKHGKHMTEIYDEAIIEDFHCTVVTLSSGMKVYAHPTGVPFPTYDQFRYRVQKAIGLEKIHLSLYGEVRHRTRIASSMGRFSEEVANLMERIEADGRYLKERPRGYVDGTTLPPMCAVESRDVLSGMKLAIGFAFEKENSTAYRMMLFCMAVPKDFFCSLFGVTLKPGEWLNEGLPPHFAIDRGPGARKDLIIEIENQFPIRDMAPSWSGQSKATVESGHHRTVKIEGEPTFIQSNLTPVELARKEIYRLIKFNHTADMEDRLDPDSELATVAPTPIGLWMHYDALFRNDGYPMRIDEAVRNFLTTIEFSVREDGVYLGARLYYSDDLRASGALRRRGKRDDGIKLNGYVLDMCVRHIWVEVNGKLLMLDAKLRIRGEEETLYMSLGELEQWTEARRKMQSAATINKRAASTEYNQRFESDTGKPWNSDKRKAGKPKKDCAAMQEAKEARPMGSAKQAA